MLPAISEVSLNIGDSEQPPLKHATRSKHEGPPSSYRFSNRAGQSEVSGLLPNLTGQRLLHDGSQPLQTSVTPSWPPGHVFVRRERGTVPFWSRMPGRNLTASEETCCPGLGVTGQLSSLAPASGIPPRRLPASNCPAFARKIGDIARRFFHLNLDLEDSQPPEG
jgi:hypothetical protein